MEESIEVMILPEIRLLEKKILIVFSKKIIERLNWYWKH
jgi:hypothetical protein